ncbi:MAG: DegT/DnrJ/EryC1/StrS family aminotransferase [Methylococcaceae bacterium]|nr:DegT/DnrJ/EryC1/StrS family aminotransferase [Methylococcaceae bacterium]
MQPPDSSPSSTRNPNPFLVFGAPDIRNEELLEVIECLKSGWIGTGPKVAKFENDFAVYKGVSCDRVAAVNSCTAALHLGMLSAGLLPGDEVITTPMTFCATVNAMIHAGLKPVLADIEPGTFNIDPAAIEATISPRTRAIVPVHFAGRPCRMDRILAIAAKYDLKIIEDCAHAIETEYHGQKAGTFGDFGCFSFYVTKNVVTGEGGMVIGKSDNDIGRIKVLALHGMSKDAWKRFGDEGYKHYQVVECGYKYNMTDLQAALGIHQLARVEFNWLRREAVWRRYQEAFADLPARIPAEPEADTRHAYHLYTILLDDAQAGISRDAFLTAMTARKIGVGVHYLSLPEHPYYQAALRWNPQDYPIAQAMGRQTVSLPLSSRLTDADVDYVIDSVRAILKNSKPLTANTGRR